MKKLLFVILFCSQIMNAQYVLMPKNDGNGNQGWFQVPIAAGGIIQFSGTGTSMTSNGYAIILSNPPVSSGNGVLMRNSAQYSTSVNAGTTLSLFELNKSNTDVAGVGHSEFVGIKVVTADSGVDCGVGVQIDNFGRADNMHLLVSGITGAPLNNRPTGIGIDLNRKNGGVIENSITNKGFMVQGYDWSQTNQGTSGPIGVLLRKHLNPNTDHILLYEHANRRAQLYWMPGGAGWDGTQTLVSAETTGAVLWKVRSDGSTQIGTTQLDSMLTVAKGVNIGGGLKVASLSGTIKATNGVLSILTASATPATTGTMTTTMTQNVFTITPTGACTFNASGGQVGSLVTFIVTTSGASSFVLTFGTNFKSQGTLSTGTVTAKTFAISFVCSNGTTWVETGRTIAQ